MWIYIFMYFLCMYFLYVYLSRGQIKTSWSEFLVLFLYYTIEKLLNTRKIQYAFKYLLYLCDLWSLCV